MAWFRRAKTEQNVLPEIEKYYDAEKRERAGLAWLLAVVSIACVALLLIGAFFGGRWVYRKTTKTNKTPGIVTVKTNETKAGISGATDTVVGTVINPDTPKPSIAKPDVTTPSPTTPVVTPPTNPSPATPSLPTPSRLVNTGPGSTLSIFIVTSISFAVAHNLLRRKRSSIR